MKNRVITILTSFLLILPLSGCGGMTIYSQYREASDLELVRVVGVDSDDEGLTVSISTGTDGEGSKPIVISRRATSLAGALQALANNPSTREPYYSHAKQVLIGEQAAKDGIAPYLDFVERSAQMRGSAHLAVVCGSAQELMTGATDSEVSAEMMLTYLIENAARTGESCVFDASEVTTALAVRGCALIMAISARNSDTEKGSEAEKRVAPAGFAIISDGKLVDYAQGEAARGVLLLTGRLKSAEVEAKDADGRAVSLQLTGAKVKWKPVFDKNDKLSGISVDIHLEGNITAAHEGCDLYNDQWRESVQDNVSAAYERCTVAAFEQAKSLKLDFLDIYGNIDRVAPYKMEKLGFDEFTQMLPELKITVDAKTEIKRTFDLESPMPVDGSFKRVIGGGK